MRWLMLLVVALLPVAAHATERFGIELEAGPVWQTRNDVQIPNDDTGTRFSILDVTGKGPWSATRVYLTWNFNERHGLRATLAPLSITETGTVDTPVDFAGEQYVAGTPLEATYKFNSWRIGYSYRFMELERAVLRLGFTAKVRDAKIELVQGQTSSRKTDVGFVPLLNFAADWTIADGWHGLFDFEGLAGGPGRAFDVALKLRRDLGESWSLAAGYRTVEGGADIDEVYTFAWLHYAVVSVGWRN